MALERLPIELILRISDHLSQKCGFYLALASRKLAAILLPRSRLITLSYASHRGKQDLFFRVLEQDVDFSITWGGRTILEEIILNRHDDYVAPLLDRGVGIVYPPGSICAETGVTLLHLAAAAGCSDEVLKRLLVHGDGVDPFKMDDEGLTPLLCAVNQGRVASAKMLIDIYREKNKEIDPPDAKYPLLLQAAMHGNGEMVLFLLQTRGVRVDARGTAGENALHWLTRNSIQEAETDRQSYDLEIKILDALLAAGIDLSAKATETQATPLHSAAENGLWAFILRLVSAGADLTARCSLGGTPLHWAARAGCDRTINALVDLGANVHDTDSNNRTPLLWAYATDLFNQDPESDLSSSPIWCLLKHGSRTSHLDVGHQNILHLAAFHDRFRAATILLAAGIDVNVQSVNGSTALHLAALNGSLKTAVQLLRAQPDLALLNTLDQSAIDVAIEKGHEDIVALIRKYEQLGVESVGGVIPPL
ncbi:uncharacterized protein GIQ15_06043 [Arthroderma uncinatum]|uniref:uncharacterized protein n=1 Tax=Arthroderma uncinatum TaxID=74035 RepID=UPI00144AF810|nr:uncharacterized protein GIQ15_06043 [Arthroderma uncinatum]KAF3480696.1 hypothetical protein GIQ15_06043 [Arthroderma uncinatum]